MNSDTPRNDQNQSYQLRVVGYWFNLIAQPALAVCFIIGLAWGFGHMQRNYNWFNDAESSAATLEEDDDSQYACSMLCVFVGAPGRCPVCGMELQKIEATGDPKDIYGVTIDPTARRISNIETVAALNVPMPKATVAMGRITYDETTEATVSAWVGGRIEKLFVDFTGTSIRKGDELAILYSPNLYADQVGMLQAKRALNSFSSNPRVQNANQRLYQSARQRLVEQGMTSSQIDNLESTRNPKNQIKIFAPISGTVVERMVEAGKYVKTGSPILKIADLSTVWMMLEMYPEDASSLRIGQQVSTNIQSQPGQSFQGKIAFIEPIVDEDTRTVNVRVEIPNDAGLIKIGDFGQAVIESDRTNQNSWVVVPRESVLMNGSKSICYVETKPGRFEFRKVEIAETTGDRIALSKGIKPGEQVVSSGAFMLDSAFNIQGKVSLIDPDRLIPQDMAQASKLAAEAKEIEVSFASLTPEDRKLAESQVICPVAKVKLGTMGMGVPIRIKLPERDVMICCAGCENNLRKNPQKYFAVLASYHKEEQMDSNQAELASPIMDAPPLETTK